MKLTLELARLVGDEPEDTLAWDEESGEIIGALADTVIKMAREAAAEGSVTTHPYPTTYVIESDPLRSRRDLALVLSTRWAIPKALRDAWPEIQEDEPSDVDLVY